LLKDCGAIVKQLLNDWRMIVTRFLKDC